MRHRARRRRPRPVGLAAASRATSPAPPRRPRPSSIHGGLRYLEYYEFRLVREALIEREVLLQGGAPHHLAAALRAAAPQRPAAGLDDPARPLPLRPSRRPRAPAADAALDLRPRPRRRAAEAEPTAAPSSTPTAGSTMPAWWCSTPSTRASAAPSILTRTRCVGARREDGVWRLTLEERSTGARDDHAPAPWSTPPVRGSPTSSAASSGPTRRRRSRLVKGSHIVVSRLFEHDRGLHLPERRRPHRLRHSLRARFHADRHHRHGLSTAIPANARHQRRRDRLSLRGGQRVLRARRSNRDDDRAGPMPACARSTTTAPANAQAATRDYVLELDAPRRRAAALGLRRQDHDLSPARRTGAGDAQPHLPARRGLDARPRRFRAATCRSRLSTTCVAELAQSLSRFCRATSRAAMPGLRHARRPPARAAPTASTISGSDFGDDLSEREVDYLVDQRMGRDRRRHPVAALQARPAPRRRHRGRARRLIRRFAAAAARRRGGASTHGRRRP